MAKPVKSIWTVTYDLGGAHEYVLVEPGLLIEDELEIGWSQVTEDGDYIEADDSEPMDFGNTKREFKVTVYRTHASPAAAREYCLATDLAIPRRLQKNLTVAITGGATYVYAMTSFSSGRTVPRRGIPHATATTYELKCGALSLGTPAGPDPVGLDDAPLNLSGVNGLLNGSGAAAGYLASAAEWINTGTGGNAVQASAGSRPVVLTGGGVHHPGIAGNYVYAFDDALLDLGATFALRWDGEVPDYTPTARMCLLSKWTAAADKRSYALYIDTAGTVTLEISTAGTAGTVLSYTSTVATGLTGGTAVGISATKTGTSLVFRLYSSQADETGIQLGDVVTVTASAPANTTAFFEIGSTDVGTLALLSGLTRRVAVWNTTAGSDVDLASAAMIYAESGLTFQGIPFALPVTSGSNRLRTILATSVRHDGTDDSMAMTTPAPLNAVTGATVVWSGVLNRVSGTQDLVFCGTNSTNPRALLRLNGTGIELHVRRLDAEATAVVSYAAGLTAPLGVTISANIDYAAGTATIYVDGSPKASGALTSAGATSATDSSETRIMAGQGGANPTAGDVHAVHVSETALGPLDHAALVATIRAESY
jgi:hypothetical protein